MLRSLGLQHGATLTHNVQPGFGLAASASLRRLVACNHGSDTLSVFEILDDGCAFGFLYTIGGGGRGDGPLQFAFYDFNGAMCFTVPSGRPTLLVAEARNNRVQELDVADFVGPVHVGFPIYMPAPCGVAASACLIAVSFYGGVRVFDASSRVSLFTAGRGCGAGDGQLRGAMGLRLSADGTAIVVADYLNDRVSKFSTRDGAFVGHVAAGMTPRPVDVEELGCEFREQGWLVTCCGRHYVAFVTKVASASVIGAGGPDDVVFTYPTAVALLPGTRLVVREYGNGGKAKVFCMTDEWRIQKRMSPVALAWLGCVVRASDAPAVVAARRRLM